jgi:hypothetical protein
MAEWLKQSLGMLLQFSYNLCSPSVRDAFLCIVQDNFCLLAPCRLAALTKCYVNCSSSQPFTFSNVTKPDTKPDEKKAIEEDEDEPPKVTFTSVTEEGAVYSKRYIATRLKLHVALHIILSHPHVACKHVSSAAIRSATFWYCSFKCWTTSVILLYFTTLG